MFFIVSLFSFLFLLGLVSGMALVAANPTPYFAALGLVLVAGLGCGALMVSGGAFLSLILLFIYLGGMLVVFAYAVALADELYPSFLGDVSILVLGVVFFLVASTGGDEFGGWEDAAWVSGAELYEFSVNLGDMGGIVWMFSVGGGALILGVLVLLLGLFVALELTRGLGRGALRAV